ncbi:RagB/SusD family nutrient uptake outer membrane protein [uncultured Bacteroides sp.]|uniref:RagB/SusD family nutrient uptake outer membrane protein n=1 Tax=uncultured Bacteroides sp. TaxID=162156 RepID=UPI00280B81D5|nr:RagB/SusD family nutrient uptake outer membrane protein [uncultured Bacteroides sp.]
MKTTFIKRICFGALLAAMASCDILDVDPLDTYTEEDVFSDVSLLKSYVHRNYNLPQTGWDHTALRYSCDESINNFNWNNSYQVLEGSVTPDQLGNLDIWSAYYENIKNCNIFFEHMDYVNKVDQPERNYLIGEATFFRAFYYMELVNRYGGVPMITKSYQLDDTDEVLNIKRASYTECVDSIVGWFDRAATYLPEKYENDADFGRVTKVAALALKSRMLLYAASPWWNVKTYEEAAKAAEEVINLCGGLGVNNLDPDYQGLFLNPESSEIIFQRLYTQEFGHWFDAENSPNGWHGYSATCVTQEMVDSYEKRGGIMPDTQWYDGQTTTTVNPWEDRDPRFYASIVCDGQSFRDGEAEFYVNEDGTSGGKDSEYGTDNWNYSETHYTIRKLMDENLVNLWSEKAYHPWIYCRLAEIYLNYAEAKYFCGDEITARQYVNFVRERARNMTENPTNMLPDVTESGEALLKRIQQERKVELAFEEHRYFDVRRWKIAEDTQVGQFHGIKITKKADGTKTYTITNVGNPRKFIAPNHYLAPIPNYERRKNSALEQNPGYTDL